MRVIGVIDLLGGQAVHARGGRREAYQPVRAVAATSISDGNPITVAGAYLDLGIDELYIADLDAIAGGAPQDDVVAALGAAAPVWLDAGISSEPAAAAAVAAGASRIIVGLETLSSIDALAEISAAVGGDRVAFSLDLRDGRPVTRASSIATQSPARLAAAAADAGATAVIVLDLARVGAGTGLDLDVISGIRAAAPRAALLAGGGVRGLQDLASLASAGCDGALVATAIHDGRLKASDIVAARRLQPYISR